MATGRNDLLWRSAVYLGEISLVLNMLLCLTTSASWSGWESVMTHNLDSIYMWNVEFWDNFMTFQVICCPKF